MKDSEFIQLLNLYLDHEISAADAARLETEVQSNGDRQKIYQQYCRMQKACKLLTTDFTPELEPQQRGDHKVVSFREQMATATPRRARAANFYTVGTLAAAACIAIIFIGRNRQSPAESSPLAGVPASQVAPAVLVASTPATSPTVTDSRQVNLEATTVARSVSGPRALGLASRSTLVADPLLLTGNTQADAMLAAAIEQANTQFAWMHNVQLAPIEQPSTQNNLRFEMQPASLRPDGRSIGSRATEPATEMAAFQFSK